MCLFSLNCTSFDWTTHKGVWTRSVSEGVESIILKSRVRKVTLELGVRIKEKTEVGCN